VAGARIETHEAVVRAEPEAAGRVRLDAIDHLAAHFGEPLRTFEAHAGRILRAADHVIHAAARPAHPQNPTSIHVERVDGVVTQAREIEVASAEVMEAAALAIEQVEAAADRADPQVAALIFDDRAHLAAAEPGGIVAAEREARETVARRLEPRET